MKKHTNTFIVHFQRHILIHVTSSDANVVKTLSTLFFSHIESYMGIICMPVKDEVKTLIVCSYKLLLVLFSLVAGNGYLSNDSILFAFNKYV